MNLNQRINEKAKQNQFDKSNFKGKDLGLLNKVIGYLDSHGLEYELRGGAANNMSRHYNDIDIAVPLNEKNSANLASFNAAKEGIIRSYKGQESNDISLNPSFKENVSKVISDDRYVNMNVGIRAKIKSTDPKTEIDLNFEQDNFDPLGGIIPPGGKIPPNEINDSYNGLGNNFLNALEAALKKLNKISDSSASEDLYSQNTLDLGLSDNISPEERKGAIIPLEKLNKISDRSASEDLYRQSSFEDLYKGLLEDKGFSDARITISDPSDNYTKD